MFNSRRLRYWFRFPLDVSVSIMQCNHGSSCRLDAAHFIITCTLYTKLACDARGEWPVMVSWYVEWHVLLDQFPSLAYIYTWFCLYYSTTCRSVKYNAHECLIMQYMFLSGNFILMSIYQILVLQFCFDMFKIVLPGMICSCPCLVKPVVCDSSGNCIQYMSMMECTNSIYDQEMFVLSN